jgi:hypothetical protein
MEGDVLLARHGGEDYGSHLGLSRAYCLSTISGLARDFEVESRALDKAELIASVSVRPDGICWCSFHNS